MKKILIALLAVFVVGCAPTAPTYSNLVDPESQDYVAHLMTEAGISATSIKQFLTDVNRYNTTVNNESLIAKGFVEQLPTYDDVALIEKWEHAYPTYIGNNCRITSFGLLEEMIEITGTTAQTANLFMDRDAIRNAPHAWLGEDQVRFATLYGFVPTPPTKNIDVHLENMQRAWQQRGIHFKENMQASLISVVFHSTLDDNLFIGHAGVLLPDSSHYVFIEKLSFEELYQAIRFANKQQLNDYLMAKYDVAYHQPEAAPFIMENDHLLEAF